MKKIVFITGGLISGGAERVMSIISNTLSEKNYNISIISKQNIPSFYELNKKINLIYPTNKISYRNSITRVISTIKLYADIYTELKKIKPDVVIPFSTKTNGVIIIISKILNLKVIASEHNNYKVGLNNLFVFFVKRFIYKMSDCLLVLTARDYNEFYSRFMKNVVVMPNPINLNNSSLDYNQKRKKIILAVGNVSRWKHKGFDNLIAIFAKIHKSIPDHKLQIIGAGDKNYLEELCCKFEVLDKVEFVGQVKNIQKYMQAAEVFALTSRYEGLPMVLIESMSQGLPCVAYDCFSGPAEIITNGEDGILVENQNKEQFAFRLKELINDKIFRKKLSKNGIIKVKKYSIENVIVKWEKLLINI